MDAINYILDELLKDNLDYIELYTELDRDGEREKKRIENIKCYIQDSKRVKYTKDKRTITINAYVYIKGDPFPTINNFDGNISVEGQQFKINGGRKYRDTFSREVVYTKLEVI